LPRGSTDPSQAIRSPAHVKEPSRNRKPVHKCTSGPGLSAPSHMGSRSLSKVFWVNPKLYRHLDEVGSARSLPIGRG